MAKLAIAWPLKRRFVTSVIIGARNLAQLESNMEIGNWDMPEVVWNALGEKTLPEEEYLNWFNKKNYEGFFSASEFHDETMELP
jgi:aryl-alcohol dehydrogenase-like predicted oxidoreductase